MAGNSPNLLVRAIWFVFVGWWLTGLLLSIAWLLNLTIVGLPLGIALINKAPYALTLKHLATRDDIDGVAVDSSGTSPPLVLRGLYFVFVGWWASGLLMLVAYLVSLTVIGLPIGIMLFNYLPYVTSLKKHN
ncbi:YccF domain-containing protein [Halobacteria archaeon AArc-dxtr1]|nr:YccF domain-containing protein [Halobacteria archaeon AArc-dxtr1]